MKAKLIVVILSLQIISCAGGLPSKKRLIIDKQVYSYALSGSGEATVVFQSGGGDGMDIWEPVFSSVGNFAKVFAYDRPGYGKTHKSKQPRTGKQITAELRSLLKKAGLNPPYVLVAHSLGGLYAMHFARTYPNEVSGMVLIDSAHPDQAKKCEEYLPKERCRPSELDKIPEPLRSELKGFDQTSNQIKRAGKFPNIPLVVLVGAHPDRGEEFLEFWLALQKEFAAKVEGSRLIATEKSGNYIHHQEPALVIHAIQNVVDKVAAEGR